MPYRRAPCGPEFEQNNFIFVSERLTVLPAISFRLKAGAKSPIPAGTLTLVSLELQEKEAGMIEGKTIRKNIFSDNSPCQCVSITIMTG
jgi:hypothetical protein